MSELLRQQVRFTSLTDCDGSTKTDKRNNLKSKSKSKKNAGVRSKFFLEGIRQELYALQQENEQLRRVIMQCITPPELAEKILLECESPPVDIFLRSSMMMEEEEEETKEGESELPSRVENNSNHRVSAIKIGEEIEIVKTAVPVEELVVPCTYDRYDDKHKYSDRSNEFGSDEAQCLVDAFTSEFAY